MGGLLVGTLVGDNIMDGLGVGPETREAVGTAVDPAGAGLPTLLTGEEVGDDRLPATGDDITEGAGDETAGNEVGVPGPLTGEEVGVDRAPAAADGAGVEKEATGEGEVGALDL